MYLEIWHKSHIIIFMICNVIIITKHHGLFDDIIQLFYIQRAVIIFQS